MDSPAPWTLRGHAYVCALAMPDALRRPQGGTAEALGPATGRLGVVMFVDYQRSEVGPYRELLFMPGPCRFPDGHRRWSIGRIYVSSEDSARNGNRNWGLDKRVASFQVERTRYGESVTVRYQDRDIAGLTLKRRGPALPVLGPWLPERWRRLGQVRDNQQFVFAPSVRSRLGVASLSDAWGNGKDFPQLQYGRGRGSLYLPDFRLDFPEADIQPLS